MRHYALSSDASDVLTEGTFACIVLFILLVLRYVVTVVMCMFYFCLISSIYKCDVCVCFDVCSVFVVDEARLFLLTGYYVWILLCKRLSWLCGMLDFCLMRKVSSECVVVASSYNAICCVLYCFRFLMFVVNVIGA